MADWIAPIIALLGPKLVGCILPGKVKRHRKALLTKLLNDDRFPQGRSLEELTRKTGMPEAECTTLLSEIGGRGIKLRDGREGWTLGDGE